MNLICYDEYPLIQSYMLRRDQMVCIVYLLIQSYNRDLFLFLYFLLIIVSAITSFTIHNDKSALNGKSIMYLNRHQTEEWKGWMQVCNLSFMLVVDLSFDFVHVCLYMHLLRRFDSSVHSLICLFVCCYLIIVFLFWCCRSSF